MKVNFQILQEPGTCPNARIALKYYGKIVSKPLCTQTSFKWPQPSDRPIELTVCALLKSVDGSTLLVQEVLPPLSSTLSITQLGKYTDAITLSTTTGILDRSLVVHMHPREQTLSVSWRSHAPSSVLCRSFSSNPSWLCSLTCYIVLYSATINLPCFPYLILSEKIYYSFSSLPIFWAPPPCYLYLSLQWLPVQYKSKSFQPEMDQTISVHLTGSCTVKTCSSHLAFKQICLGSNKDSSSETYHRCI